MKKVFYAPYLMLALALVGVAISFYDAYAIYNAQALWCPPPVNGCNEDASSPYARIFQSASWVFRCNLLFVHVRLGGAARIRSVIARAAFRRASLYRLGRRQSRPQESEQDD